MRFISGSIHGFLDYAVAVVLIIVPLGLDFQATSPIAHWLSIVAGVALFIYSLLTDYSISYRRVIPLGSHLMLDFLAGVAFILSPFIFGFGGIIRTFYLVMGISVVAVVFLTQHPSTARQ